MGVKNLTSYVGSLHGIVWESYDLSGKPLVIDGSGLAYLLYLGLDCRYGGQYSELEDRIVRFFKKLTSNGVEPYVIFDGILDISDKKLKTFITRKNDRIRRAHDLWFGKSDGNTKQTIHLPLLIKSLFLKVLEGNYILYAVADFEADHEIASVANSLEAPVMSLDSDFYIFDVKHGYIPFDKYDFEGTNMKAKRYKRQRLAKHLDISVSMLPVLASLVGNDYVSDDILACLPIPARGYRRIESVTEYLSSYSSPNEVIESLDRFPKLKSAVTLSVDEYQIKPSHLIGYLTKASLGTNLRTYNGHTLPSWLIEILRSQNLDEYIASLCHRRVFLRVDLEDMGGPASNKLTTPLRDCTYKLSTEYDEEQVPLNEGKKIDEYGRKNSLYELRRRIDLLGIKNETQLSKIQTFNQEQTIVFILNVLSCELSLVTNLLPEWQLVIAALRFWITNATPAVKEEHLTALLVYFVDQKTTSMYQNMEPQHAFAQWQQVILWVNQLNTLFSSPFPFLHPARLYDGKQLCLLYKRFKEEGIQAVKDTVDNAHLYQALYSAVQKDLPQKFENKKQVKKVRKPKGTQTKKADGLLENTFASLYLSSETDED